MTSGKSLLFRAQGREESTGLQTGLEVAVGVLGSNLDLGVSYLWDLEQGAEPL